MMIPHIKKYPPQEWPAQFPKSIIARLLAEQLPKIKDQTWIWVLANLRQARGLLEEIKALTSPKDHAHLALLPDWEILPYEAFQPNSALTAERLLTLHAAALGQVKILLTTAKAYAYRVPRPEWILQEVWQARVNTQGLRTAWMQQLASYQRCGQIQNPGEYALRGNLLDVYPFHHAPCRLEFLNETLESIQELDKVHFLPRKQLRELILLPRFEYRNPLPAPAFEHWVPHMDASIKKRIQKGELIPGYPYYLPAYHQQLVSLDEYFPNIELLIHAESVENLIQHQKWVQKAYDKAPSGSLFPPETLLDPQHITSQAPQKTSTSAFTKPKRHELPQQARVLLALPAGSKQWYFKERLKSDGIVPKTVSHEAFWHKTTPEIVMIEHPLWESFAHPASGHYVFHMDDWYAQETSHLEKPAPKLAPPLPWETLSLGQKIVHLDLGIGQFEGIVHLNEHENTEAFLKLRYAQGQLVYVPVDALEKLTPHYGDAPLSLAGQAAWKQKLRKVQTECEAYAAKLLHQEATRSQQHATALIPTAEYDVFLEQFHHQETEDQRKATEEIIGDMSKNVPMDRLLLGDVGFGKTEVLLRAAFITAMRGYQTIMLCPTTLLAQQHYQTACERFANWPIQIGLLNRLQSLAERKATLQALACGQLDVLIATHAALSMDCLLTRLGLLIIDEEHRFGVQAKQKLLEQYPHVHRLMVSATPIPRTLQATIERLRSVSWIRHPPKMRRPIHSIVSEYDENLIDEAIEREISRGGQIFWIDNDIATQERKLKTLQERFPALSIVGIHGQLPEKALESRMQAFVQGRHHMLLSTTLLESGIDVPKVNTLIVERADCLGLAQLHQLRGRVGRGFEQAYAYFFHPKGILSPSAQARIEALKKHDGLGSGWMLAQHDLEIRGGGTWLGEKQSGHKDFIGLSAYHRLMEQALTQLRNPEKKPEPPVEIILHQARWIPESYIHDMEERLLLYQNLYRLQTLEYVDTLWWTMLSTYGAPPDEVKNLFAHQKLVIISRGIGLRSIGRKQDRLLWIWHHNEVLKTDRLFEWAQKRSMGFRFIHNLGFEIQAEEPVYEQCLSLIPAMLKD